MMKLENNLKFLFVKVPILYVTILFCVSIFFCVMAHFKVRKPNRPDTFSLHSDS